MNNQKAIIIAFEKGTSAEEVKNLIDAAIKFGIDSQAEGSGVILCTASELLNGGRRDSVIVAVQNIFSVVGSPEKVSESEWNMQFMQAFTNDRLHMGNKAIFTNKLLKDIATANSREKTWFKEAGVPQIVELAKQCLIIANIK